MKRGTIFSIALAAGMAYAGTAFAVHGPFSAPPEPNGIGRAPAGPSGAPSGRTDPSLADPGAVGDAASGAATGGVIDGSNHNVIESVFPGQTPGVFPGAE